MRVILAGIIIIMAVINVGFLYMKYGEAPPPTNIQQIEPEEIEVTPPKPTVPALIQEVNERHAKISSLSCEDAVVKIWENGMRYKLDGKVYYEKDHNFRFLVRSIFGLELDLGSNDELFWFWSRRNKTPGLHWAVYEDYHKTRLKTPFNPVWMRTTFGIDHIDVVGATILDKEDHYVVVREGQNATGKDILNAIFISKAERRVTVSLITDTAGYPLVSCEIRKVNSQGLPIEVYFNWNEEDRSLLIELENPVANRTLMFDLWSKPDIQPQVNMGIE